MAGGERTPIWMVMLQIYLLTVSLAVPYFNWHFAKTHGFVRWLMFGELVPSAKALVWPYFALDLGRDRSHPPETPKPAASKSASPVESSAPSPAEPLVVSHPSSDENEILSKEVEKLGGSGEWERRSNEIIRKYPNVYVFDIPERIQAATYTRRAYELAQSVDPTLLNRVYSGLGDHFKNEWLAGLQFELDGYARESSASIKKGEYLITDWGTWSGAHKAELVKAVKALEQ